LMKTSIEGEEVRDWKKVESAPSTGVMQASASGGVKLRITYSVC